MKTIYDLEVGDSYWIITWFPHKYKPGKINIETELDINEYQIDLEYNQVFLTEEECQREINKKRALAKINKRAHELGDNPYIEATYNGEVFNTYTIEENLEGELLVKRLTTYVKHERNVVIYSRKITEQIIKELEEECKIVLEVD